MKILVSPLILDGVLDLKKIEYSERETASLFFATANVLGGRVRIIPCDGDTRVEKERFDNKFSVRDNSVYNKTDAGRSADTVAELKRLLLRFSAKGTVYTADVSPKYVPFIASAALFSSSETIFCGNFLKDDLIEMIKAFGGTVTENGGRLTIKGGKLRAGGEIKVRSFDVLLAAIIIAIFLDGKEKTTAIEFSGIGKEAEAIIRLINGFAVGGAIKIIKE